MKEKILATLRKETEPVSGETLSAALGISRVSVWKHIRVLQGHGYSIEAGPKGYRLLACPDTTFPWEFPERSERIHYFEEIGSTMEAARTLARSGCPGMTVVVAERQTKGRGRLDRRWLSEAGGLYFTLVLRPEIAPVHAALVNLRCAVVLAGTIRRLYGVDARLKWPNDILVEDRKLCGMLLEMEAEADRVSFINVGIGINVNNDPGPDVPAAVSIADLTGGVVSRKALLGDFLDDVEAAMATPLDETVVSAWKDASVTLNRTVRVVTLRETWVGKAVDVDDTGALVILEPDGNKRKVTYGDCFHNL